MSLSAFRVFKFPLASTDLKHVVGGAAVLLAHGVAGLLGEVEGLPANAPRGDDASAALEGK